MSEKLVLIDDNDQAIGAEEKLIVHKKGLLHRAFSIFIFRNNNNKQELLLQQRNKNKYHCGGLWTNTCCGHPMIGEDIMVAGKRRLYEEMGFNTPLVYLDCFRYFAKCDNDLVEHELDHVMIGRYDNESFQVNTEEVQDFRWIELAAVVRELSITPNIFTPWFEQALAVVNNHSKELALL